MIVELCEQTRLHKLVSRALLHVLPLFVPIADQTRPDHVSLDGDNEKTGATIFYCALGFKVSAVAMADAVYTGIVYRGEGSQLLWQS